MLPKKHSENINGFKRLQLESLTHLGEEIDHLIEHISHAQAIESNEISQQYHELDADNELSEDEKYDIQEGLIDQNEHLKDVLDLMYELAIIALYKKVEITTKKAIRICFHDIEQKKLYRIDFLKKQLKDKGIDIEAFTNYKAMNELRLINNCIKHSGWVDDKLAAYNDWIEGKPLNYVEETEKSDGDIRKLNDIQSAYKRLNPLCKDYLKDLISEFKNKVL